MYRAFLSRSMQTVMRQFRPISSPMLKLPKTTVRHLFACLTSRPDTTNFLTASFRGYPLKGKKVEVPEGYVGIVLHESIRPSTEKDERRFHVINKFREIRFWNWDKIPSKNDAFLKALDWIDVAEMLHSPVPEE